MFNVRFINVIQANRTLNKYRCSPAVRHQPPDSGQPGGALSRRRREIEVLLAGKS
jgi:hypothetical protein